MRILTLRRATAAVGLALGLCAAAELHAAEVEVVVHGDIVSASPAAAMVLATPTVADADSPLPAPVTAELQVPGRVRLRLGGARAWTLKLEAPGYWTPDALVAPSADPGPVELRPMPTAVVHGTLAVPSEETLPAVLAASFELRGRAETAAGPRGEVPCPVDEGSWRCEVPAGRLDLRLGADGFISSFFWNVDLLAQEERAIGRLAMQRGSSLYGWVEAADGALIEDCSVRLEPELPGPPSDERARRLRALSQRTTATARGFFHFTDLAPGSYSAVAEQDGFAPAISPPAAIGRDTEVELRDPLVLRHPVTFELSVVPTTDRAGSPWRVALVRPQSSAVVAAGSTDDRGAWQAAGITAGSYTLLVSDSQGSRLAMEEIAVAPGDSRRIVEIPIVEIAGRVTLGGEPLRARLVFGGTSRPISVQLASDGEGEFAGTLPRAGAWNVDVRASDPPVFRRLRGVEVAADGDGAAGAWVDIALPDTMLAGEVVDADGTPVAGANVLLLLFPATEDIAYGRSDEDGRFGFRGVAPGTYRLEAQLRTAEGLLTSDPVEHRVEEDSEAMTPPLVLRRGKTVAGRVVSAAGGVPGASLELLPVAGSGELPGLIVPTTQTDPQGRFSVRLAGNARQVQVTAMAPGFVLHRQTVSLDGSELVVPLSQQEGGSLRLVLDQPYSRNRLHRPQPYLILNGDTRFDLGTLLTWAARNGAGRQPLALDTPAMPSGIYTACWPYLGDSTSSAWRWECADGLLPPGGALELAPPNPKSSEGETG